MFKTLWCIIDRRNTLIRIEKASVELTFPNLISRLELHKINN